MILEGIVTTVNEDGSPNISPMGPLVEPSMTSIVLRPFRTSTTYQNLRRTGEGVLHVTDDVDLLAHAAVSQFESTPATLPARSVAGFILADACRWYAFRVANLDDTNDRTKIDCNVVDKGHIREFFGFNRAKHAVIEAAILATRTDFLPADEILSEFTRLAVIVDKTAGDQERQAFLFLDEFVRHALATKAK